MSHLRQILNSEYVTYDLNVKVVDIIQTACRDSLCILMNVTN